MSEIAQLFSVEKSETVPDRFEIFWEQCPLRKKKPLAHALYRKIISPQGMETKTLDRDSNTYVNIFLRATEQELIDGMKRYNRSTVDSNFKRSEYVCLPTTFLNQGRWLDQ